METKIGTEMGPEDYSVKATFLVDPDGQITVERMERVELAAEPRPGRWTCDCPTCMNRRHRAPRVTP